MVPKIQKNSQTKQGLMLDQIINAFDKRYKSFLLLGLFLPLARTSAA